MSRYQTPYLQYFDAAGKPLAGGKLFFYEAGTNDTKSVYTDTELSIPAANPVTLNSNGSVSNIFYAGLSRVVLKNSTGTQVFDIDNVGPEDLSGLPPLYVSDSTYSLNDIVKTADGLYYRSTQNGNAGNTPSVTSEFWEKVDFLYTYNPNTGYQIDDVVKHDGQLYISTAAANLGNDPSTSNNWRKLTTVAEFEYLSGGLTLNKVAYPVGTKANVKSFSASTGGRNSYWLKQAVTGPASQLPSQRLDLQCTDATGAVWALQHSGTVFISSIGGDEGADNGLVFRAYDTKADYLDLEGKTWPCTSLNTDNGAGREILQAKVFNGKLVVTNSLNGETNVQEFAPFLESEIQLSETKSPIVDWTGLNVLWLGTSIPHQGVGVDGYPERLAEKLNFTVQNWAWSGSHAFYDIDGDAFNSGTVRALSMTEADRLAGLALYGTSSAYDDSFNIVIKASEMTAEYRIKRQFESGAIDCVVLDHNHNDRKNIAAYESNDKTINAVVKGTTTTFTLDDAGGLSEGDGCYVRVEGIVELDYAAGRITGISGNQVTVAIDSSGMAGVITSGTFKFVDRGTVNGAFDFLIAYTKNMGIRYGQEDVKIILCGAPSYFTNDVNRDHAIWSVNRSIKDIADEWQLPFFDVANALRLTYRDHLTYLPDEVHPSTPETRAVFTNIWAEWLNGGATNFYNPEEVLQRNKAISNVTNQPALYSKYDESFATRSTIYTEDDELINDDFTGGLTDWTELGTGTASVIGAPWGVGSAVKFDVLADNTAPYIRQDVAVGEAPILEFDFYMPDVDVATGVTQQTTIASINSSGGAGYSVGIIQTVGGATQLRATYNKGGFGQAPVVPLPGATVTIANTTKYRVKLDVVDGYIFFSVDGDILYAGAIDNSLIGAATSVLVGPTFTNMSSAYSVFIGNVIAGSKSEQHVMTTEELQKTVQSYTLAELQGMNPTLTGRRAICSDRADAPLKLMDAGYTASPGDITAANGRVWALQVDGAANVLWFGAKPQASSFDNQSVIQGALDRLNDNGGGELVVPLVSDNYYGIQGPLVVYSNIAVKQYGDVLNYGTADLFWRPSVWWFGVLEGFDQQGSAFDFPSQTLSQSEILPEDTSVQVSNGSDWSVGDVVLVESSERLDASIYPNYSWLNTVERIVGNTLYLKYASGGYMGTGGSPIIRKIPTKPEVTSPSSVRIVYSGPCFLCVNSSLELFDGARFGSTNPLNEDRWSVSLWLSCYECEFKGKGVIQATKQIIAGNPFSHSTIKDLSGLSQESGCELAYLTHNSYFENAKMSVVEGSKTLAAVTNGFTFSWLVGSEGGHTNYFKNCEGHFGRDGNVATTTGQSSVALIGKNSAWSGGVINGKNKPIAISGRDLTLTGAKVSGGKDFGVSGKDKCIIDSNRIEDKDRNFGSIGAVDLTSNSKIVNNYLGDGSHFSHQIYDPSFATKSTESTGNTGRVRYTERIDASTKNIVDTLEVESIDCNTLSVSPLDDLSVELFSQVVNNGGDKIFNVDFRSDKTTIVNISQAASAVVTVADGSAFSSSNLIWIDGVEGMTEINGKYHTISSVSGNNITISTDTTGFSAYTSGGEADRARRSKDEIIPSGTPSTGGENVTFKVEGKFLNNASKRLKLTLSSESVNYSTWFSPIANNDETSTINIVCRTLGDSYQVLYSSLKFNAVCIDNRSS